MQYKVPQNVGIEDRIVGPLTLRQLIILAVGLGASYVLFAIMSKLYELNILEYIVISIPAIISVAAALIKINDITFSKYLLLVIEFAVKPKKRIWDHRGIAALVAPDLTPKKTKKIQDTEDDSKTKKTVNLDDLGRVLDSGGFEHLDEVAHADIDRAEDDKLLTQAYFGKAEDDRNSMYWRTADSHKKRIDMLASLPSTQTSASVASSPNAGAVKKAEDVQAAVAIQEVPAKPKESPQVANQAPKKAFKNRPRNKKRKIARPIRTNNQVNTINKKEPVKLVPKPVQNNVKPSSPPKKKPEKKGELKFQELQEGEIEINLD